MIGALARLWAFAHDHVRDDNTLDCTPDDINHIVGVDKFCDVLPPEWFQVLDTNRVHLPHFLEDNGLDKATRLGAAQRKAKSRSRHKSNTNGHSDVTTKSRNVTGPEIEIEGEVEEDSKKRKIPKEKKVPREAFDMATVAGLDHAAWIDWLTYRSEIKKPIKPASLALAAKRLAAMGPGQRAAVEYSIASGYQGLFAPKPNGKHQPAAAPDHSAEWAEAKARAAALGFRAPWPQESVGAYMTQVKFIESGMATNTLAQIMARQPAKAPQ
jgi:hypothetical protein